MAYDYDPEDKFGYKDTLPENHPEKVITGVEFDEEFKKIELAVQGLQDTLDGQLDFITSNIVMGGTYSLVSGLVVRSLKPALVEGQPLPAPADCPDTFLICIDDGPFEGEDLVRSDWIVSSPTADAWIPLAYSRQDAVVGEPGEDGEDGKGWTGGNYNPSNGIVTFISDDGLTFTTTDIRGEDGDHGDHGLNGKGWTSGSYNDQTGVVTFISDDGLGFATSDLRGTDGNHGNHGINGQGWTSGSYDDTTGIITFTSDDGLGFATGDVRGADGTNGTGIVNSLDGVGPDSSGDLTELDPTVPQYVKDITQAQINEWNSGGGGAVDSVNGKVGVVTLNYSDVGAQVAGSYATSSHNHNGVYQPAGSYAASSHNHNGVYAPASHTHSYAGVGVSYTKAESDAKYQPKGSSTGGLAEPLLLSKGIAMGTTQSASQSYKSKCVIELQSSSGSLPGHTGMLIDVEMNSGWSGQIFKFSPGNGWGTYGSPFLSITSGGCISLDFVTSSDERLKDNITTAPLGIIDKLHGREWDWKKDGKKDSGVIAQEIEAAGLGHLVSTDTEGMKAVSYGGLIPYLIEELKDCRQRIKALEEAK